MPATKDIIENESEDPRPHAVVAIHFPRPSSVIEAQLAEFLATIPAGVLAPTEDDFPAQLQWDAWQNHRQELEAELDHALDSELAGSDLQFAFSGAPVVEHNIAAGFLGNFISKAQSLLNALAQATEQKATEKGKVATSLVEDYRLLVSGTFASSFGIKFRLHTANELGRLRIGQTSEVLDQFCGLLDPQIPSDELVKTLTSPRVRGRYYELVELVAKEDAKVTVRSKTRRRGVRLDAKQARDRATWMDSLTENSSVLPLKGFLTGGSIATNKFELQVGEEFYRGRISPEAKGQMKEIKMGESVAAEVIETTFFAEEALVEGHATYFLKSIMATPATLGV
jgi:hypothetical protein